MLNRIPSAIFLFVLLMAMSGQAGSEPQDKPQEKLGPKAEPAAMGSDYQPLLWMGTNAAFALDTVRFGTCQIDSSAEIAAKSSNPELQQLATHSMDLQQRNIKKLRSMAKVIDFRLPSKKHPAPCAESGDLSAKAGTDLDKSYLAYLAKDNAADIARFQDEAESLPDSANFELQKYAAAALPALTEQQKSIDALKRKLAAGAIK